MIDLTGPEQIVAGCLFVSGLCTGGAIALIALVVF